MPQRDSVLYTVYANGIATALLEPTHIGESAGAHRLDTATLEYVGGSLQDFSPAALFNQEIEIVSLASGDVVHWGKVTQQPILLSGDSGETIELVSRTELYHLGDMLDGYLVYDPVADATTAIDGDLVFNPMVDGKVVGNLNDTKETAGGCYVFLDPESVRTEAARTFQDANTTTWTLSQAVFYLLKSLNASETYITNPDQTTLDAVFSDPTALVNEVRIPRGTHLAKALDILIEPLGYRWKVDRTGVGLREYKFWKVATGGSLVTVWHQRYGTTLSNPRELAETNASDIGVTYDISNLANVISVRGGFEEYEITVQLLRGWKTSADPTGGDDLQKYDKDSATFANVKDVYRKWVLNEAGDYIGTRPEIDGIFTSTLRSDLSGLSLLNHFIARRRKFMPTLTLKQASATSTHELVPIGTISGVEVEYSNTATPEWKPVAWDCALLEQECGIYFDFQRPPEEFAKDPANLRIRVTATIQSDYRITGLVTHQASSPNSDNVPLILDLPDRFRYKVRNSTLSKYGGGSTPSLAVDDGTAIQDFADYVRDKFDLMDIGGPITLEGTDHNYNVGDRVSGVQLKNIPFLARTGSTSYPQIVAIEYLIDQQSTVLHLERQRDVIRLPSAGGTGRTTQQFRPRHTSREVI